MDDQSDQKLPPFAPRLVASKALEPEPAEEGSASISPSGENAASATKLPSIAEKADDLEAIKKAVDDAASVGGGLWLSYISVLLYLAVAAGAVTHSDLFFEKSVKLPFLGIELPLFAFFALAPILFLIVHAYTLVHLVMLTEKAQRFHEAAHNAERNVEPARRENLQWQLPSNIFIQFLAGPSKIRGGMFGLTLRAIARVTLVIAPILLLLLMQVQFLPYHSAAVILTQRVALGVDLALILWLWRKILSGREIDGGRRRVAALWLPLGLVLSSAVLLFSGTIVTFPGEWQDERFLSWPILPAVTEWGRPATETDAKGHPRTASIRDWVENAKRVSLHEWLFNEEPDPTTRRRVPFSSTLVLPGLNVYEGLGIDDPEKAKWHDFVFLARGRDLKGAIFDLASLPKVDFGGAELQGASLHLAQLQGASLQFAQLQGASLDFSHLQGASLNGAQLQGASLYYAQLQGASLDGAKLQGAPLDHAQLQGASLDGAKLQGASLSAAQLQGASLHQAQLQGASLDFAQLQGASLDFAQLQGASLDNAHLEGASLDGAKLQGASLNAELQGASLDFAELQGASLRAVLLGASLERAALEATDLSYANLWRTNSVMPPSKVAAIRMSGGGGATWKPEWVDADSMLRHWDDKAYQALRTKMDSVPQGGFRDKALERIRSLDCSSSDKTLASCNPHIAPPPEAVALRKALEAASVDDKAYTEALAKTLKSLVCSSGDDAVYVARGGGFQGRLKDAGAPASTLIDDLMNKNSKDCPVSAALTDTDRAKLLQIKQDIETAGK